MLHNCNLTVYFQIDFFHLVISVYVFFILFKSFSTEYTIAWMSTHIFILFGVHFHALEKEMATHSSVLAWRIPGTEEPSGLPTMGSHRIRHD